MDKKIIARNFSRYARYYDRYADVQGLAAINLTREIKQDNFCNILEIGCGTGNYTLILRERFKDAKIKAVDISAPMVEIARAKFRNNGVEFIVGDAETYRPCERFDFITSNACFQWFDNLESTLRKYKNLLSKNGIILFSIFGPKTLWELGFCLRRILRGSPLSAANFCTRQEIGRILGKNFKRFRIEEFKCRQYYPGLEGLLRKIKYTGVRGSGLKAGASLSRGLLRDIEKAYLGKFSEIRATYQVFFCRASR